MPARLCAPSQISSGSSLRVSSRPGSETSSAACGSTSAPRNASAAATASARLLLPATITLPAPFARASSSHSASPRTTVHPGLHDGELLGGDRLARVAEHVHVVERDVREHDDPRAQDVRRVVAAAEPRLDHGDVDLRLGECEERRRGDDLELRRVPRMRPHPRDGRVEVRLGAVDRGSARSSRERAARDTRRRAGPASASSSSVSRVVVDLPFVPTTCTAS